MQWFWGASLLRLWLQVTKMEASQTRHERRKKQIGENYQQDPGDPVRTSRWVTARVGTGAVPPTTVARVLAPRSVAPLLTCLVSIGDLFSSERAQWVKLESSVCQSYSGQGQP